jgi:uncharacterized membrane protein
MPSFYLPFIITVGGMLLYQVSQKSMPKEINPFHATAIAYLVGIVLCVLIGLTYTSNRSLTSSLKIANWAVVGMGVGAAAIEIGFMLAYRMGWRLSITAVSTNVTATVILIPIGVLIFREHLSLRTLTGVGLCILGLLLVVRD